MKLENAKTLSKVLLLIIISWTASTTITQALKCPKMTLTELVMAMGDSLVWEFRECSIK